MLKLRDVAYIALALVLAAGPAEYLRMSVMRWDPLWFKHEDMYDSPSRTLPDAPVCPADGTPLELKKGSRIILVDPDERNA